MADEHDRWLDREAAELLLRGESPEVLDPAARERAERLAGTLGALAASSGPAALPDGELPGEEAALAAFRHVRAERDDVGAAGAGVPVSGGGFRFGDAGLVTIGGRPERPPTPLRCRSLRLALAAVLAVGMIGGVAFAAGNGVLPTPFGGTEPEPAATVSAAASPDRPLASPSPLEGTRSGSAPADGGTPGTTPGARADEEGSGESGEQGGAPEAGDPGRGGADGRRPGLVASCRKVRAGKDPDGSHRRALKQAAGGSSRIAAYCRSLLKGSGSGDTNSDTNSDRNGNRNSDIGGGDQHQGRQERDQGQGHGGPDGRDAGSGRDARDSHDGKEGKDGKDGKEGKDGDTGRGDDDDDHIASAPSLSAPSLSPQPRHAPTHAPHAPALSGVRRPPSPGV